MLGDHSIAGFEELHIAGEIFSVKGPVGVIVELFKTLVGAVGGKEKGFGIGDVNSHGHVEGAAGFPHRIETRIVDFDEAAFADIFAKIEAERFENLESAG